MNQNITFEQFSQSMLKAAAKHGTPSDARICQNVLTGVAQFISDSAMSTSTVTALESLGQDKIPVLANRTIGGANGLSEDSIVEMLVNLGVPAARIPATAVAVGRIVAYGADRNAVYGAVPSTQDFLQSADVVGRNALSMVNYDATAATEAFGVTIDTLQQDNRLNMVLTILRAFDSIVDKVLPRVSEESATITVKIPTSEVYSLEKSNDKSAQVRYGSDHRIPLVQLYRNPTPVSTILKPITPLVANDQSPSVLDQTNGMALLTGAHVNLFDLALDNNRIGHGAYDYSDLVAEGARVTYLIINGVHTDGSTVTTEQYKLPTNFLDQSKLSKPSQNYDSGDTATTINHGTMLRATSKTASGAASAIMATYTDAVIQLDVMFNIQMNLKTSDTYGFGTVRKTLKPIGNASADSISAATKADFDKLEFSVFSYNTDAKFDEQNMRKTTTAVRVNRNSVQYVIPMGRNVVAEYSLKQVSDADVTSSINIVNSLGNSDRGLNIIQSRLSDIASMNEFIQANPEYSSIISPTKFSIAATLCLPRVIQSTLSYTDSVTLSMRESERLSDMHGRLREVVLSILTQLCAESLYLNNLDGGETVVFKVITYSKIADMIFGIVDYHDALMDQVAKEGRSDMSMRLPNGYRLDIVKCNFDYMKETVLIIPVRANAPTDPTSFATIRDCGGYTASYNNINNNGVETRTVTNQREIVFPTNPIGAILTVTGIDDLLKVTIPGTV